MNKIIIRKVKKEDLNVVSRIIVTGWKSAYKGIIDNEFLDNMNLEKIYNRMLKNYNKSEFVVAELNNEVVGFCKYTLENLFSKEYNGIDGELCAIYVNPEMKRSGIGKALFSYVFNEFMKNGNKNIIIWCLEKNYPSRAFYEHMGGELYGRSFCSKGGKEYPKVGYRFKI